MNRQSDENPLEALSGDVRLFDPSLDDSLQSDLELVKLVQQGNKRCFDLLVIKYQGRVLALVTRFVKDTSEAQDVAQEAFIRAYRAIRNFRGDSAFYTWLYRIAVNTAKNHLLARKRRPQADVALDDEEQFTDGIEALHDAETPETQLSRDQLKKAIDAVIASMSEELRRAICLREFEGRSYEEIADILGCPIGTVRSRIFRAREMIDDKVKDFV